MTRGQRGRSPSAARAGGLRALFAVREFRGLWAAFVLSAAGDRLALVALTLLVYDRTRSPFLSAVAYASGTVPYLAGGLALSGLADRLPRRALMIGCDLARAALAAAMAWPGMPLAALIALLYLVTLIQPPFDAARSAVTRDALPGSRYALGTAVMQMTFRVLIIAGAAAGGVTVTLAGAPSAPTPSLSLPPLPWSAASCGRARPPRAPHGTHSPGKRSPPGRAPRSGSSSVTPCSGQWCCSPALPPVTRYPRAWPPRTPPASAAGR